MQFLVARHVNVLSAQHGGFLIGLVTDKETPFGLGGQSKLVIYGLITPLLTTPRCSTARPTSSSSHIWTFARPIQHKAGQSPLQLAFQVIQCDCSPLARKDQQLDDHPVAESFKTASIITRTQSRHQCRSIGDLQSLSQRLSQYLHLQHV